MRNFLRYLLHEFIVRCWPVWLIRKITKCTEISYRSANYQDLTFFQKIDYHWHMTFCQPCVDYKKQLDIIDQTAKKFLKDNISDEQKKRLDSLAEDIIKRNSH